MSKINSVKTNIWTGNLNSSWNIFWHRYETSTFSGQFNEYHKSEELQHIVKIMKVWLRTTNWKEISSFFRSSFLL